MSLYIAVITFFLLLVVMQTTKNVYYLTLMAIMGIFISLSIADLFNAGVQFSTVVAAGTTQQTWLELMYGFFTFIAFGRAAVNAFHRQASVEEQ